MKLYGFILTMFFMQNLFAGDKQDTFERLNNLVITNPKAVINALDGLDKASGLPDYQSEYLRACSYYNQFLYYLVIEKFAKEEIEASGFPIYSFNEYWTSNAVTKEDKVNNDPNGDKHAYYYQYGAGFDSIQEGDPYPYYSLREQPKLYRCISVSKQ